VFRLGFQVSDVVDPSPRACLCAHTMAADSRTSKRIYLEGIGGILCIFCLDVFLGWGDRVSLLYLAGVLPGLQASSKQPPVALGFLALAGLISAGILTEERAFLEETVTSVRFLSMFLVGLASLLIVREAELKELDMHYYRLILDLLKHGPDEAGSPVYSAKSLWERMGNRSSLFEVELRELRKDLHASQKQIQSFYQLAPAMIHILDLHGVVRIVNEYWLSALLYRRQEVEGRPFVDIVVERERNRVLHELQRMKEEDDIFNMSVKVLTAVGDTRDMFVTFSRPIPIDHGNEMGRLVTMIDVTEEKRRAEAHQSELEKGMERHRQQTLGMLATGVAHGFNNMLQPILTFTEMALQDIPKGSSVRQDLEFVLQSALRAKELVQQVEAFSQKDEQERRFIYLEGVVRQALRLLRTSVPDRVRFRDYYEPECPPIKASPAEIHQLLTDLVANAIEAVGSSKEPIIEISMKRMRVGLEDAEQSIALVQGDEYVVLAIQDNGDGISPEHMDRIFDPFFSTRKVAAGSGMGLASAMGIMRKLGGTIMAGNRSRGGARFRCLFPVQAVEPLQMAEAKPDLMHGHAEILFVDDEPIVLHSATRLLQRMGFNVHGCSTAAEALEALEANQGKYDLLITDLTMPGMTGLDLAAKAKAKYHDLPILLATGIAKNTEEEGGLDPNVDEVIYKPYKLQDLDRAIQRMIAAKIEKSMKKEGA